MVQQLVLLLLCSLGLLLHSAGAQTTTTQELYVKPTENTSCPEPCHTLDEYVQNASQYFVSDTTFKFFPGNHTLSRHINISGSQSNLALQPVANNGTVHIACFDTAAIRFAEISGLKLENLFLSWCGTLTLSDMLNVNIHSLHIELRQHSLSWILKASNIFGNSTIESLTLVGQEDAVLEVDLIYSDDSIYSSPAQNQVIIKDMISKVSLACYLRQSNYIVDLLLVNLKSPYAIVNIHAWENIPNNITLKHVDTSYLKLIGNLVPGTHLTLEDSVVNSTLAERRGYIAIGQMTSVQGILLRNITFSGFISVYLFAVVNLTIIDCNFDGVIGSAFIVSREQAVLLIKSHNVNFVNCSFGNNIGTPIMGIDSTFVLSGTNVFSNNTAYEGGAIGLYGRSRVLFSNGSETSFFNNSAETVGGAIFVHNILAGSYCFFEFEGDHYICKASFIPPFNLTFDGNEARSGGNKVYGGNLDKCLAASAYYLDSCKGWTFVSSMFNVDLRYSSDLTAITSDPTRACLCVNGRPSCTTVFSDLTLYPGDTFQIPAVVVGDRFGTVDGSVYAHLLPWPSNSTGQIAYLEPLQYSQLVEGKCTNTSYTILSNSSAVLLILTVTSTLLEEYKYPSVSLHNTIQNESSVYNDTGGIGDNLRSIPVYINITLLPCPLGFVLSGEPPRCNCDTRLKDNDIQCNLTTQTVQRSGTEWINASFENNTYSGVIVSRSCPNNYCKAQRVNVNLEYPDTQCAFNHSETLCGGCQLGLSLALGSTQCLSCSNEYLALLIPFALAGLALVFFIQLLNLTVAEGTLNGIIFYANIMKANQFAWNLSKDTSPNFLVVFIAWINLDLGIETCFFDGLDACWKAWLQFAFPLYVWGIAIVIVVLSRYFSTAAKVFGSNSVQTLATLFFLSYSKLFRTTITILQASSIVYPDGHTAIVWSYDGNISYLAPKHLALFLVALAVIIFLWLPYTGTLTSAQFLQRIPSYWVTKVLFKLKPVLDAYYGPFKDKHRYWVGLLLLVRGVLFITFAATSTNYSDIGLLLTFTATLTLLMYLAYFGQVYKKNYLSLLENSCILNLGIFAGGTLYINSSGGSQTALAYISVGIAFVQFLVVVVVHATASFKVLINRFHQPTLEIPDRAEYEGLVDSTIENAQTARELSISFDDFREPVLKYADTET